MKHCPVDLLKRVRWARVLAAGAFLLVAYLGLLLKEEHTINQTLQGKLAQSDSGRPWRVTDYELSSAGQEVCPEEITITDNAIIPLKERVVDRAYDPVRKLLRMVGGK